MGLCALKQKYSSTSRQFHYLLISGARGLPEQADGQQGGAEEGAGASHPARREAGGQGGA